MNGIQYEYDELMSSWSLFMRHNSHAKAQRVANPPSLSRDGKRGTAAHFDLEAQATPALRRRRLISGPFSPIPKDRMNLIEGQTATGSFVQFVDAVLQCFEINVDPCAIFSQCVRRLRSTELLSNAIPN